MNDVTIISDKILSMLNSQERLKCSYLKREDNFCYIKVENYKNDKQDCIIINDEIFFEIDDEEYYKLNDYEKAVDDYLKKLDEVVNIQISYVDDTGEEMMYGFCSKKNNPQVLISIAVNKLKNEYSFMNNILLMKVEDFYGEYYFEAKWDGKTFVENTSIKR